MSRSVLRWVVLAGVIAVVAAPVRTAADDKAPAGRLQSKQFEKEIKVKVKLGYLLSLPQDYAKDEKKAWPLVLFLHGAGESGNDLKKVTAHGPPKLVAAGKDFPFILVAPQSPGRGWEPHTLNALLDDVVAKHRVDRDRIYVTGLSMGGFGTWILAAAYPERFAAIIPICGGGNPTEAKKIKDLPIWIFHGAKDRTVPPSRSEAMLKALKDAGAKDVHYTLYDDAGHDSWTRTYDNPKVWEWLLKQRRGKKE